MKFKTLGVVICCSAFSWIPAIAATTTDTTKTDGEIIAVLIALNKNEIAAAKETLKKPINADEKKYAQELLTDHTKNLQQTLQISKTNKIKPVETETAATIKADGAKELKVLIPLKGKDYQTTYINAMVKGHTEALEIVDNALQNVKNPALKKHLEATHDTIAEHLEMAKDLQGKLNA